MLDLELFYTVERLTKEKENAFSKYCLKENIDYRILIQKKLYLLTHGMKEKLDLPYEWNFYIYGPYSSEMAHMIYHLNDYYDYIKENNKLKKVAGEKRDQIDRLIESLERLEQELKNLMKALDLKYHEIYEIAATVHYIALDILDQKPTISRDDLIQWITYNFNILKEKFRDKIKKEDIGKILNYLIRYKFLKLND